MYIAKYLFGCVKLKGAKFRKYVGHSSHVTNVRFSLDKSRLISTGGADHAIFQWRFVPESVAEGGKSAAAKAIEPTADQPDDLPNEYHAYMDSNSEDSDSEASGREIDSDVENEKRISYERKVYKDDLIVRFYIT